MLYISTPVAPWGWLQFAPETCNSIKTKLVGNELLYKTTAWGMYNIKIKKYYPSSYLEKVRRKEFKSGLSVNWPIFKLRTFWTQICTLQQHQPVSTNHSLINHCNANKYSSQNQSYFHCNSRPSASDNDHECFYFSQQNKT
jgi:hypothetical protein